MSIKAKVHLIGLGFSVFLGALNWQSEVHYARVSGVHFEHFTLTGFAALLCLALSVALGTALVRQLKSSLVNGRRVTVERWVLSRSAFVYLVPLVLTYHTTSSWVEKDGAIAEKISGFGDHLSIWVFLFGTLAFLLFQMSCAFAGATND